MTQQGHALMINSRACCLESIIIREGLAKYTDLLGGCWGMMFFFLGGGGERTG